VKSASSTLKGRTLTALSWSAASQVCQQILRFGLSIVLARLLNPADFGLVAMLAVFTGFARVFTNLGFGGSLIQKQDARPEHLDAVFWINVIAGLAVGVILTACAPLIAGFYRQPVLEPITIIFAISCAIGCLNLVQTAVLQKNLNFRNLFWTELLGMAAGGATSVALALRGFGVYSLVADQLVSTIARVVVMWVSSSWRPRLRFELSAARELFGFSGNLMATTAITYWTRNFDTLLVGKFFGDAVAGIYNRAYQLMMLPMTQITNVITRVMFPALAAIQNDLPRVRAVYLRSTRIISLITFPLMLLLMVLAEPTMLLLYGEKWRASIPLFQILCVAAIFQSVGTTVGWIYTSQGRTDVQLKWGLVGTPLRLASFVVGIQWGVTGMVISYVLCGCLVTFYPSWSIPGRLIGLRFREMVANLIPTLLCGVVAALLVWGCDFLLLHRAPHAVRVLAGFPLGAAVYVALLYALRVPAWRDFTELLHGGHLPAARHIARFLPRVERELAPPVIPNP